MTEVITNLANQFPWLVVTVLVILALLISFIIGIVFYAVKTGRLVKLWIIDIGPAGQKLNEDYEQKKDFNKLLANMDYQQLGPLLSFVKEETLLRESVPQSEFDHPRFPYFAYWLLENLICLGFIEKARTGQRDGAPTYNYRLTREYEKFLGRVHLED